MIRVSGTTYIFDFQDSFSKPPTAPSWSAAPNFSDRLRRLRDKDGEFLSARTDLVVEGIDRPIGVTLLPGGDIVVGESGANMVKVRASIETREMSVRNLK